MNAQCISMDVNNFWHSILCCRFLNVMLNLKHISADIDTSELSPTSRRCNTKANRLVFIIYLDFFIVFRSSNIGLYLSIITMQTTINNHNHCFKYFTEEPLVEEQGVRKFFFLRKAPDFFTANAPPGASTLISNEQTCQ